MTTEYLITATVRVESDRVLTNAEQTQLRNRVKGTLRAVHDDGFIIRDIPDTKLAEPLVTIGRSR